MAVRPGISTPATKKGSTLKAGTTVMDRFAKTAKIKEETVHRQLDLRKTRVLAQAEEKKAKIGAQKDIQMGRDRIKMEYKLKKEQMKMEFELRHLGQFTPHSSLAIPGTGSGSAGSLFSAPSFPTLNAPASNYSSPIALPAPIYSESYSAASYTSQSGGHSSQANSASVSPGFSHETLQHSHAGSPAASGSLPVNGGGSTLTNSTMIPV
jgi:hypothetical protein